MQKFDLENFEFNINPSTWDAAQDLIAAGAVRALSEVERNFWTAQVVDHSGILEVELILTSKKINGYTCDCWGDARRTPCRHVAAAAAQVRQFLHQKKEEKKANSLERAKAKQENPKRLTVRKILDGVAFEALQEFVLDFARTNRDFSLALKTRFASMAETQTNPYKQLIESILPKKSQHDYPLKRTPFMRVRRTLKELEEQAEKALEMGDYQNVANITFPVLQAIGPLAFVSRDSQARDMIALLSAFFRKIAQVLEANVAPEFRVEIEQQLLLVVKTIDLPDENLTELCGLLAHRSQENALFEQIKTIFEEASSPTPKSVLLLFSASLAANDFPQAIINMLKTFQIEIKDVFQLSMQLDKMGFRLAACVVLFDFLEANKFRGWQERQVEDYLIEVSPQLPKADFLPTLLVKRFIQTGQLHFLEDLKEKNAKKWPQFFKKIKEELVRQGAYEFLILALAFEEDLNAIEAILSLDADLSLLTKAMPSLVEKHPEWLKKLYLNTFSEHLETHFGPPAARQIAATLQALIGQGHIVLAGEIGKALLKSHGDRPSLPEEVREVFPKSKRTAILGRL